MANEFTLVLIKPDIVKAKKAGLVLSQIEKSFEIVELRYGSPGSQFWRRFYAEHAEKPFYEQLVDFMFSDYIYAATLFGDDVVHRWREEMGATDPNKAKIGTIREQFGSKTGPIMWNAVHGSDRYDRASMEIQMLSEEQQFRDFGLRTRLRALAQR
jgi:nucleoside-diphosphate kinase